MTITPDKSALAQARERLERAYDDVQPWINRASVMPADLRLVLDALKEAERVAASLRVWLCDSIELFDEFVDVPDRDCSCHISPPCDDCVKWAHVRERLESARALATKDSQ